MEAEVFVGGMVEDAELGIVWRIEKQEILDIPKELEGLHYDYRTYIGLPKDQWTGLFSHIV